jgi:hypothetical protein
LARICPWDPIANPRRDGGTKKKGFQMAKTPEKKENEPITD